VSTTDEILAAADRLVRAFGSHDTAAYFGCFDPGATFIFYTTTARLASRAEYEQLWRTWEREDEFRVLSCVSAQPAVQELGDDVGIFSHDVTTVVRTRAGEETVSERETIVFRRDGGRWAAVHEHLSPRPEPAADPLAQARAPDQDHQ
jgi:ketosteroid isomerase-like protein